MPRRHGCLHGGEVFVIWDIVIICGGGGGDGYSEDLHEETVNLQLDFITVC
jgi:hypothetical protein